MRRRSKREHRGFISVAWDFLMDFLLGSISPDANAVAEKSAGVIAHEARELDVIEEKLKSKESHVESTLAEISSRI